MLFLLTFDFVCVFMFYFIVVLSGVIITTAVAERKPERQVGSLASALAD